MMAEPEFVNEEEEEPDLERSLEELDDKRVEEEGEQEIEAEPLAEARYVELVDTLDRLLDGEAVDLDAIAALSAEDREALELLEHVVSGRTASNTTMYAEERLEALNQVLAQLQPLLSVGSVHDVLNESLNELVDSFEELRNRLRGLEDAEEEIFHEPEEKAVASDGDGDKDEPETAEQKAAKAQAGRDAKAAKDDELERERKVRSGKGGGTKPAAADDYDYVERPARPSTAWNPADRGPGVEEPARPSTAWDPDDREGGGR